MSKKIIVAVSTGVDSMVLLHKLMNKHEIIVVHINHHKRKESKNEEKYIKEFCLQNSLKLEIGNFYYNKGNFQNEARKFRYNYFQEIALKYEVEEIYLGHHQNDVEETVLFKLLRGENLYLVDCLKESQIHGNLILKRPLINYLKKDLYKYAKENNITYFEDESNEDETYSRNKIRKFLKENNLLSIKEEIKEMNDYFINIINEKKVINNNELNIEIFNSLQTYLQKRTLQYFFNKFNLNNLLSKKSIEKYLELLKENKSFKEKHKNLFLDSQYGILSIYEKIQDYEFLFEQKLIIDNHVFEFNNEGNIFLEQKHLPLKIRNFRENDVIKFSYGSKKLSRFFIDIKLKNDLRQKIPIIVDKNDRIIFIPSIKLTKYCKNVYHFGDIVVKYSSI